MDIDGLFINSIISIGKKDEFLDAVKKVPAEFMQGEERAIYQWIKVYFKRSKGVIPSKKAIRAKFPDFSVIKPDDTIQFYVTELRDRADYEILTDGNTSIQRLLFGKDIEKAKVELRKIGIELGKNEMLEASTVKANLSERKKQYIKNKKLKGKIGYQTTVDSIDNRIGGIVDEFFVIMGPQGVGKTFLMLMMLCNMWKQVPGPIAVVTNEISKKKMEGRTDSIMGKFSYSRYRKGLLRPDEAKRFVGLNGVYEGLPDMYVIPGAGKSVDQIEYELMSIDDLSLLGVDGLYLTDMGKGDEFDNTRSASRSYQRLLSRLEIPGVFTTQMTDKDETKYARAIGEDADMILKMWRSQALKDSSLMGIEFLKIREEDSAVSFNMDWDFDKWLFREHKRNEFDSNEERVFDA